MTAPVLSLWKRAAQGWRKMKTRKRRLHDESTRSGRGRERGVAPDANRRECRTLVLNFAPTPVACSHRSAQFVTRLDQFKLIAEASGLVLRPTVETLAHRARAGRLRGSGEVGHATATDVRTTAHAGGCAARRDTGRSRRSVRGDAAGRA